MTAPNFVTTAFIPGFRLIDGSDLNAMVAQMNAALQQGANGYPFITALTTVGAGTINAAGIIGGITTRGGAQAGAAFTDTTDTAAAIITALGSAFATNGTWLYIYQNATNAAATLAGGTGVTLSGTNTVIPGLTWASYLMTKTSATAVTMAFVDAGQTNPLTLVGNASYDSSLTPTMNITGLVQAQLATITAGTSGGKAVAIGPAADMITSMPNFRVGTAMQVTIKNISGVTFTLTGLPGVQLKGTATDIQPNKARTYALTFPSLSSADLTGLTTCDI